MFKKLLTISVVFLSICVFSNLILPSMGTGSRMGALVIAGELVTETELQEASITIVSPNGGENLRAGKTQSIRWTYAGSPGLRPKVKIELLKGGEVHRIINSSVSIGRNGSGSYNWRIPSNQSSGSDYRIRITSTSNALLTDVSANDFSISSPNTVVGTWEVTGTGSVKVTIPGYPAGTQRIHAQDEFIFYTDGTFEMIDAGGTWSQNGRNFIIELDPNDIIFLFETMLGGYLGDLQIDIQQNVFSGTVSGNTISGKWNLKMDMHFLDLGLEGNATASVSFRGSRLVEGLTLSLHEDDSLSLPESLMGIIGETVRNVIEPYGATLPE